MTKSSASALVLLAISTAPAAALDLTCIGDIDTFKPRHTDMVGPGATIVDLDNPTFITTPAGKFDVKRVSDESISFGGESASYPGLTIYGTLNLLSGEMSIFGGKPPDTHIEMSAQFSCKRAKRLEPVRRPPEGLLAPNHMFTR